MQNHPYSYIGKHSSDFARLGSSSEDWLSDLGLGRLVYLHNMGRKGPGHARLQHGRPECKIGTKESETSRSNAEKAMLAVK